MQREKLYNLMYRLRGSTGMWFRWYRRGHGLDFVSRRYERLLVQNPSIEFVIVPEVSA